MLAPFPAVTLSKVTSLAVDTVILLPLRVILMLSPLTNLTVSLAFTGVATSLLACNLKVWFCNAVMLPALVATFAKLSFAAFVKSTL